MTQTIALKGNTTEVNPLYIELRRRFAMQGDRTIGEVKAQEAIRDGYQPFATPVRRSVSAMSRSTSESHITRANSLPSVQRNANGTPTRRTNISAGAVVLMVLCATLLIFLLISGIRISAMNKELAGLQKQANELRAEEKDLTLSIDDNGNFAAEGACKDGDGLGEVNASNLLRAFSAD